MKINKDRVNLLRNEIKKCFVEDAKKYKDTVDIMWHCRNFCQNANEDMYVCYVIGGIQTELNNNQIYRILSSVI